MVIGTSRYRYKRAPSKAELERAKQEILAPLAQAPGFRGYYFTMISETESLTIALWESEEDRQRALDKMMPSLMKAAGANLTGPPESTVSEVLFSEMK